MPNRIIREGINDSKAVNSLSEAAEIFYRRLLLVVDDFGRLEADPELIRGELFKRQHSRWPIRRVTQALNEVATTLRSDGQPLVLVYKVGNKEYLEVTNFGQRVRATKSKYPEPTARHQVDKIREIPLAKTTSADNCQQMTDNRGQLSADDGQPRTIAASRARTSSSSNASPTSSEVVVPEKSGQNFEGWWAAWSKVKGTNHRTQAEHAYVIWVTESMERACAECTASYLASLQRTSGGYNPENFLVDQSREKFAARWPPARASPAGNQAALERQFQFLDVLQRIE